MTTESWTFNPSPEPENIKDEQPPIEAALEADAKRIFGRPHPDADTVQIEFDWRPTVVNDRLTFYVFITRGERHRSHEIEIDLGRLDPSQEERLYSFLGARHAGVTSVLDVALATAWLLEVSLYQQQPNLSKPDRDTKVREMLLFTYKKETLQNARTPRQAENPGRGS